MDLGEDLNLVEEEQALQDERILGLQLDSEGKSYWRKVDRLYVHDFDVLDYLILNTMNNISV